MNSRMLEKNTEIALERIEARGPNFYDPSDHFPTMISSSAYHAEIQAKRKEAPRSTPGRSNR